MPARCEQVEPACLGRTPAIEAAHVGDVTVDEVAEPARRGRTAVKAGQEILVVGYARPERRRTSADRGAIKGRTCVHANNYNHHEYKSLCGLKNFFTISPRDAEASIFVGGQRMPPPR
jgi:hypothetical protein